MMGEKAWAGNGDKNRTGREKREEVDSRQREPGGNGGSELRCSCIEIGIVFGEEPLSFEFTPGRSCWYLWVYQSRHKEKLRKSKQKTPE